METTNLFNQNEEEQSTLSADSQNQFTSITGNGSDALDDEAYADDDLVEDDESSLTEDTDTGDDDLVGDDADLTDDESSLTEDDDDIADDLDDEDDADDLAYDSDTEDDEETTSSTAI